MSTTPLNLESKETIETPETFISLDSLNHDENIDRSSLEGQGDEGEEKYDTFRDAFIQACNSINQARNSKEFSEEDRELMNSKEDVEIMKSKGRPDYLAVIEHFQLFFERFPMLQFRMQYTLEMYTGELRVPGSETGSHICIYANTGGVLTKLMTIQDKEDSTMEVFIYGSLPRKLIVELSGVVDDDNILAFDVKVNGFVRKVDGLYDVVAVTDDLIMRLLPPVSPPVSPSMVTPQPTVATTPQEPLPRRVRHRALSDLVIPSSAKNLSSDFEVCAEEMEESKRKKQRLEVSVSVSAPSSPKH